MRGGGGGGERERAGGRMTGTLEQLAGLEEEEGIRYLVHGSESE